MLEMFQDIKSPISSSELQILLKELYGDDVTNEMFVEATLENKDAHLNLIILDDIVSGYIIWFIEKEVEEEEELEEIITTIILTIDEIVVLPEKQNVENAKKIIGKIDELAKKNDCSIGEITLPSQSFWLIPTLTTIGDYNVAILRVSKELEKKTEFVGIFNKIQNDPKPEIIELMVSKEDVFQLEIIEEPTDYKKILESGYNPEIVSMIFNVEENNEEKLLNDVNKITEWQEYSFSLIKYFK